MWRGVYVSSALLLLAALSAGADCIELDDEACSSSTTPRGGRSLMQTKPIPPKTEEAGNAHEERHVTYEAEAWRQARATSKDPTAGQPSVAVVQIEKRQKQPGITGPGRLAAEGAETEAGGEAGGEAAASEAAEAEEAVEEGEPAGEAEAPEATETETAVNEGEAGGEAVAHEAPEEASAEITPGEAATGAAGQPVTRIMPFGKEDVAKELQTRAASTQDTLVDAIENAEVAEIKRSVFRSLTRLRAAQIKEFDTIARLETQAIDEYNDNHHYRNENPLAYIHSDEPKVAEDKYTAFH